MKDRLDVILYNRGYFASREKAKAAIMSGDIFVDGKICDKAGTRFNFDIKIDIKSNSIPYVSRGGLKLEKAIDVFGLNISEKICVDMGASTGGFTDCMLQNGAKKVYAIDVGYGQLDYKLRTDDRVCNMEKTNIRYMTSDDFDELIDFISIDVSFISLKHMFPIAEVISNEDAKIVALIKPQFEAGRQQVGKKGIVRDKSVHIEVIENVKAYARDSNLYMHVLDFSPITGTKGNIEYLALFDKHEIEFESIHIKNIIDEAYKRLR